MRTAEHPRARRRRRLHAARQLSYGCLALTVVTLVLFLAGFVPFWPGLVTSMVLLMLSLASRAQAR